MANRTLVQFSWTRVTLGLCVIVFTIDGELLVFLLWQTWGMCLVFAIGEVLLCLLVWLSCKVSGMSLSKDWW